LSDFQKVRGFEEAWRPPVKSKFITPRGMVTRAAGSGGDVRARLLRIAGHAPEVMVKLTGRTHDAPRLRTHLDYISRKGGLELEDRDGCLLRSRTLLKELAEDWGAQALTDSRRQSNSPLSRSIVVSMPTPTDPALIEDATRAFAQEVFAERFDYVFVLHTDALHPHVHLAVRALGDHGERLNPRKVDLEDWRQVVAQSLRDRGVEAEATPRRARGVTRKAESTPMRKIRELHEAGLGSPAKMLRAAYHEAAKAAFGHETAPRPWEISLLERQAKIRALYLAQANLLKASDDPKDRALGLKVEEFVRVMPAPDSQRLALARELRAASRGLEHPLGDKDRSR
jgi:hypothetical protein